MQPRKQSGVKTGRRQVAGAAEFLGVTEKVIRARAARMLLPHHRRGERLVFVQRELEESFASLPGCSVASAIINISARHDTLPINRMLVEALGRLKKSSTSK
jgi:hypothetical protein